ncbi:hypothetical protein ACLEIY_14505 [Acetobacter tropicalis]|uniref:hypothetical protein n=1 Tax=Acetobacter TaxID=434 RepID=UPI00142E2A70|nr:MULTISPECIES: hypothetical protein [Acetobacter]MCP1197459.1 hypothetical protein [Acetobacter senegalensis]
MLLESVSWQRTYISAIRHSILDRILRSPTGQCPQLHGPYENMEAAVTDFLDRTAIPKITRKKLSALRDHGYAGDIGGKEMILHLDRWTGATTLSDFELVEESIQT